MRYAPMHVHCRFSYENFYVTQTFVQQNMMSVLFYT